MGSPTASAVSLDPALARRGQLKAVRETAEALLYLAPSLLLFGVFVFVPLARTIYLSLFTTNPIGNPRSFTGLNSVRSPRVLST